MNRIRHEQIQRTGNLESGSLLWTTGSEAIENQFLPNARSIEKRIQQDIDSSFPVISGSVGTAGPIIVGNVYKSGSAIYVEKVSTPSGGESTYLSAVFDNTSGSWTDIENGVIDSYTPTGGEERIDADYGDLGWTMATIEDSSSNKIELRSPMVLLFINGVSQPYGPWNYEVDWRNSSGYSIIYINMNILQKGDNITLLHLSTQPWGTYSFKYGGIS